jgi:hypothetical protein
MNWKTYFEKGKEIILISASKKWFPHANIVNSLWFVDNKILIKDSQMNTTLKNFQENPYICIISWYLRIKGKVEIFCSWKYFDLCKNWNQIYPPKNAILINIDEIFNLDTMEIIK